MNRANMVGHDVYEQSTVLLLFISPRFYTETIYHKLFNFQSLPNLDIVRIHSSNFRQLKEPYSRMDTNIHLHHYPLYFLYHRTNRQNSWQTHRCRKHCILINVIFQLIVRIDAFLLAFLYQMIIKGSPKGSFYISPGSKSERPKHHQRNHEPLSDAWSL